MIVCLTCNKVYSSTAGTYILQYRYLESLKIMMMVGGGIHNTRGYFKLFDFSGHKISAKGSPCLLI